MRKMSWTGRVLFVLLAALCISLTARALTPGEEADACVAQLKDPDAAAREKAAVRLGELKIARAVAPLSAALSDAEPPVRVAVVKALGAIGDTGAITELGKAIRKDTERRCGWRWRGRWGRSTISCACRG